MQTTTPKSETINSPDSNLITTNYHSELWTVLSENAKIFALNSVSSGYRMQTDTIRINPHLLSGCSGAKSFILALTKLNLDPSKTSPQEIVKKGVFGWHGTKTVEAVYSIAKTNLDPAKRKAQEYGPGEYCADNPTYSLKDGYCGDTSTLFVFFIIKESNPYYKFSTHYVINNPSHNEMYMVPILIVTFNNKIPIFLENETTDKLSTEKKVLWQWHNDYAWIQFGEGQIDNSSQTKLEENYQNFLYMKTPREINLNIKRLDNLDIDVYVINFEKMTQLNLRTNFTRNIRRIKK